MGRHVAAVGLCIACSFMLARAVDARGLARVHAHALVEASGEVAVEQGAAAASGAAVASFFDEAAKLSPHYQELTEKLAFVGLANQKNIPVNIIFVTRPLGPAERKLFKKYKDEILFLGVSSFNEFPLLPKDDRFSNPQDYVEDYLSMFPGWLHMMHDPEKHFPPHVKTILMSESDFSLPAAPARDYSLPKKYDFTYSASDCDVDSDGQGWCGWSKNWALAKEALVVMCGEFNLTGVLVATKDKSGKRAYSIPESCKGKIIQTSFLPKQRDFFNYVKQSRFVFLPQVHDASPRVSTQALAHDVPILMNYDIAGGWKYVNNKTGEFFHGMSDIREALRRILKNSDIQGRYEPRKWVLEHYGTEHAGKRLLDFVVENFSDRVTLPRGTTLLQRR